MRASFSWPPTKDRFWLYGAAEESNLPSRGLHDLTGFEGQPSKVQLCTEAGFSARFRPLRSSWVR